MKQNKIYNILPFESKVGLLTLLLTLLTLNAKQETSSSQKKDLKPRVNLSTFNSVSANRLPSTYFVANLHQEQKNSPIDINNLLRKDTNDIDDMPVVNTKVKELPVDEITVKIVTGKKLVKYIYSDGSVEIRQGGTLPWRNKNPGALRRSSNSVGRANGFVVFASEEEGTESLRALLRGENYKNLTLKSAIFKYAPPHENDTKRYQANIKRLTGLDLNVVLRDLTDAEMERVIKTIKQLEGWVPGKLTRIEPLNIQQNKIMDTLQNVR